MELFHSLIDWYMTHLNYFTVGLLMVIESSFIPFPSEVVIPVAAYKAARGDLNIFLVILAGTIGALIGALVNYYLAYYLGRPIIHRLADSPFGKAMLLSKAKVIHAEEYFNRHGRPSTFIGRLVPAVRQLISLPAGLAKMNMRDFILYTTAGAGLWNIILAIIGYYLYEFKDKIYPYLGYIMIGLGVVFVTYLIIRGRRNRKRNLPE